MSDIEKLIEGIEELLSIDKTIMRKQFENILWAAFGGSDRDKFTQINHCIRLLFDNDEFTVNQSKRNKIIEEAVRKEERAIIVNEIHIKMDAKELVNNLNSAVGIGFNQDHQHNKILNKLQNNLRKRWREG